MSSTKALTGSIQVFLVKQEPRAEYIAYIGIDSTSERIHWN